MTIDPEHDKNCHWLNQQLRREWPTMEIVPDGSCVTREILLAYNAIGRIAIKSPPGSL
jgi:hypothetical protein